MVRALAMIAIFLRPLGKGTTRMVKSEWLTEGTETKNRCLLAGEPHANHD